MTDTMSEMFCKVLLVIPFLLVIVWIFNSLPDREKPRHKDASSDKPAESSGGGLPYWEEGTSVPSNWVREEKIAEQEALNEFEFWEEQKKKDR